MNWNQLMSLRRQGDKQDRLRKDQDETRLGFEVDYDRIVFSSAFRSLQDKTQVIPLSKTSFVHTRLTHSLEVSVVGRTLGRLVGQQVLEKYPDVKAAGYQTNDFGAAVAAAALAHDIGNPPFGHSGEKAIGDYFKNGNGKQFKESLSDKEYQDLISFEGNAHGFHLLNKSGHGISGGIRLSYATLGAFMKYPKESLPIKPTPNIAHKKYGVFQEDKKFWDEVGTHLGMDYLHHGQKMYHRHPLAFLVEAADDICYTIIDFEDGINLGVIEEEYALEFLINLVRDKINTTNYSKLLRTKDRLAYLRALSISTLIEDAVKIFMENEEAILNGAFAKALTDLSKYDAQINDIISLSVDKLYRSDEVTKKELKGYRILNTLLDRLCIAVENKYQGKETAFDKLTLRLASQDIDLENPNKYSRLLSVCSFVSNLTDGNSLQMAQLLK